MQKRNEDEISYVNAVIAFDSIINCSKDLEILLKENQFWHKDEDEPYLSFDNWYYMDFDILFKIIDEIKINNLK